jgi:hypothetical protein
MTAQYLKEVTADIFRYALVPLGTHFTLDTTPKRRSHSLFVHNAITPKQGYVRTESVWKPVKHQEIYWVEESIISQ